MKIRKGIKSNSDFWNQTYYIRTLFVRLFAVLILFSVCRFLFYLFNLSYFKGSGVLEIATSFLYGIRFDISAIVYFNSLYIVLYLVPTPFRERKIYRFILGIIFILFNGLALLLNIIDFEYFKFTKKRSTFDLLGMKSDFQPLLYQYIKDYWYLLLILFILIFLLWFIYRRTALKLPTLKINYFTQSILMLFSAGIFLIAARGGFQLKPVRIMDAALYASPKMIPLVLNTPFTMFQTYGRKQLKEVNYFSAADLKHIYTNKLSLQKDGSMKKMNVVIIIVESLSREFMATYGAPKSHTPFLDSLCSNALVCINSFSNGTRSMEAIPAVLSSIPHLMQDSYIFSAYQGNRINSIGSLLSEKGYRTAFFHGGTNGTMGFDSFIKIAGFQEYYGRKEYNNDKDYDGLWGIYDEEFLQFTASKLDETNQPFCAAIFTLSSHHPISIPAKYSNRFKGGTLPIHRGIEYVDYALKRFFDTASKMSWYENTIFVITGDHTPDESENSFYKNFVGMFAVPIILYAPHTSLIGIKHTITQHIDIMPSILDWLNYSGEFVAFGKSIFDNTYNGCSFNFVNGTYQIVEDNYILQFNGEESVALFNYTDDLLLKHNLIHEHPTKKEKLESHLKAIIQTYNHSMINDELTIRNGIVGRR